MAKKSGIYCILNLVNSKYYIGSAIDVKQRKRRHFSDLKLNRHPNQHLQNAFNKYGESNFSFFVLEYCSKSELLSIEQYYIDLMDACNKGYNIRSKAESNLGLIHSEESKRKQSESRKGKYSGSNSPKYGKHLSEETRNKISKTLTGKHLSEETKRKISESNKGKHTGERNGMFGKTGEQHPFYGKHHSEETKQKMSIPIVQLSKDGCFFIAEYISITDAHKQTNISLGNINSVCRGKRKTAGGFRWMYKTDYEQLNKAS